MDATIKLGSTEPASRETSRPRIWAAIAITARPAHAPCIRHSSRDSGAKTLQVALNKLRTGTWAPKRGGLRAVRPASSALLSHTLSAAQTLQARTLQRAARGTVCICKVVIYMAAVPGEKECAQGCAVRRLPRPLPLLLLWAAQPAAAAGPGRGAVLHSSSSSSLCGLKPIGDRRTPVPMQLAQHQRPLARHVGHLQANRGRIGGLDARAAVPTACAWRRCPVRSVCAPRAQRLHACAASRPQQL